MRRNRRVASLTSLREAARTAILLALSVKLANRLQTLRLASGCMFEPLAKTTHRTLSIEREIENDDGRRIVRDHAVKVIADKAIASETKDRRGPVEIWIQE